MYVEFRLLIILLEIDSEQACCLLMGVATTRVCSLTPYRIRSSLWPCVDTLEGISAKVVLARTEDSYSMSWCALGMHGIVSRFVA